MNQKFIKPRSEYIDLNEYNYAGQYNPYTYEGCVVKMADKIAYLARDIEDALRLKILTQKDVDELKEHLNTLTSYQFHAINNGAVVNYFITDVIENSSVEDGIGLSDNALLIMKEMMKFNYQNIYLIKRMYIHNDYVALILNSIFNYLYDFKESEDIIEDLNKQIESSPKLVSTYIGWLEKYAIFKNQERKKECSNKVVYDFINDSLALEKSIIDFMAGMSDQFIIQIFNELISF